LLYTSTFSQDGKAQNIPSSIKRGWPERDPPLTSQGLLDAAAISMSFEPDLIISSPMTRTIQTAFAAFPSLVHSPSETIPALEIWPDLREAHDAICNKGVSRAKLSEAYPGLDFSRCREEWDYEAHTEDGAVNRASRVTAELFLRPEKNIVLITHRGFAAFLVEGPQFTNCGVFGFYRRVLLSLRLVQKCDHIHLVMKELFVH
jgi:broad specificity phosphatase PhoE